MTELIEELEEKRAKHNLEAEKHRRVRDTLNSETRSWVERRDELNAQVREIIHNANAHRENRDRINSEVRDLKIQRDNWNVLVSSLSEKLMQLKREKMPNGGLPIRRLKMHLRGLEKKHMTTVLSTDKEKALVDEIGEISSRIQEMEDEFDQMDEIRPLEKELEEGKEQAEALHKKVSEFANQAQTEHDEMVRLFDEADKLRSEADRAQEMFIETKLKADDEHKKHIEHIRQIHDFNKIISGIHQKLRKSKKTEEEDSAKKEAEDVYDRFKKGETLSTEDLMILQKTGYL